MANYNNQLRIDLTDLDKAKDVYKDGSAYECIYEYNSNGDISKATCNDYDTDGNITFKTITTYTYSESGNSEVTVEYDEYDHAVCTTTINYDHSTY